MGALGGGVQLQAPNQGAGGFRILSLVAPVYRRAASLVGDLLLWRMSMIERYRVLAAMLALQEFTHERIAEYSGVKLSTVRTVLNRERALWDEIGREAPRGPGGRAKILRLAPNASEALREELANIYSTVDPIAATQGTPFAWTGNADPAVPLLDAEASLREHLVSAQSDADRTEVLRSVRLSLRNADRMLSRLPVSGRRRVDDLYRERLRLLSDVTDRVERGELAAADVRAEIGEPFADRAEHDLDRTARTPVYVVRLGSPPGFDDLADTIRVAADQVGARVLERKSELEAFDETPEIPVFVMHSSSQEESGTRLRRIVAMVRDRAVILDIDADELLRNDVMANACLYIPHANKLDVGAIAGTLIRCGIGSAAEDTGVERERIRSPLVAIPS